MPFFLFLVIFVGIPLTELYLLIEVGSVIGAFPTIALSLFTAALGGLLVRAQGFEVFFKIQTQAAQGEVPAVEMLEGALLLLVGFALLLPGFFTDAIGFLLLVPALRRWLIVYWLKRRGNLSPPPGARDGSSGPRSSGVIEGEYRRDD